MLENKPSVTFNDVAGVEEAKQELEEVIEFLKEPRKFTRLGGRIPKGVLLLGPPGTGKTLMAKAVSQESNANFKIINGPEIMSKFYGASEGRLRDIFREAGRRTPRRSLQTILLISPPWIFHRPKVLLIFPL